MYPLKFDPVHISKIGGGNRLSDIFKVNKIGESIGETWLLSSRESAQSIVSNGYYKGKTIVELSNTKGKDIFGDKEAEFAKNLPVLIKIIDTSDFLSVQVHPDDRYARQEECDSGKSEMWYIIDCDENSTIIYTHRKINSLWTPYFQIEVVNIENDCYERKLNNSHEYILCVNGSIAVSPSVLIKKKVELNLGELCLIPQCLDKYKVNGKGKFIRVFFTDTFL